MEKQAIIDRILRDAVEAVSPQELIQKLGGGRPLTVKLGADPSRPDLHLGHTVLLRRLRLFQQLGHTIVFVIGDFTGMIGDPTGRSRTRPALTLEQTRRSGESYFRQVTRILDPARTTVRYNSEWLGKLDFGDVIRLASRCTVARMLERDDFSRRWAAHTPVYLHELLYPLAQAYDSVALHADVELGGTDQTFNLLMGRALQESFGQPPQDILTYPLLVGLDGKEKMSKSLDNYIGLNEAPDVMFEKAMRVPDACLPQYFALTTDIASEQFAPLVQQDIRQAHFAYADAIVTMYHGRAEAEKALRRYRRVAAGTLPDAMPEITVPRGEIPPDGVPLTDLLLRAGFVASRSEARRAVAGRGVRIDGVAVEDAARRLELTRPVVLQFGKGRFCRFRLGE